MCSGRGPRWVDHNTWRVYNVVKIRFRRIAKRAIGDQLNMEAIIRNSPAKLIVGGRAILNRATISHHDHARGKIKIIPRKTTTARVLVRSYAVLARQNRAEDVRPWAIIIIMAPE